MCRDFVAVEFMLLSGEGLIRATATATVRVRGFGVRTCGGGYSGSYKGGVCVCTIDRNRCCELEC